MSGRFRLDTLELSGFRGVREKLSVPLDKPLNVIAGPNGSGKSTLLTAIEWALFTKEATTLNDHHIDERRSWEVKHIHGDEPPSVTVTLRKNGEKVRLEQRGLKPGKAKSAIQCTYGDFKSLAYVHQETLRDFLVGRPEPRQQMFQRLLGAGWAQDLAKALDQACKVLNCDEADKRAHLLDELVDAWMSGFRRQLEEAQTRAQQSGFKAPWEVTGCAQAENARRLIDSLCTQVSIPVPTLPRAEPLEDFSNRLAGTLQQVRQQGPAGRHADIAARRTRIEGSRSSYDTASQHARNCQKVLEGARERLGTEEKIVAEINKHTDEKKLFELGLSALSRQREVIRKAIDYFEDEAEAKYCPVCLQEVQRDPLLIELRCRSETALTHEEQDLHARLREINELLKQLGKNHDELKQMSDQLARAVERQSGELSTLERTLGRPIREGEDPLAVADAEIQRLKAEIDIITKAVEEFHNRINQIESEAKKVDHVGDILRLQQRVSSLGKIRDTPDWRAMVDAQRALSQREQLLKHASVIAKRLAADVARGNLERAREPITNVYRRLTQRGDFPQVCIDPEKKYEIAVEGGKNPQPATAVLNLTDLNALAVAVVAGMATTFPEAHDLEFLILDDPSQGMDGETARRLGDIISDLSEKIQIVVATPDPDLLAALEGSPRQKNVLRLEPRDSTSVVPCVRMESIH